MLDAVSRYSTTAIVVVAALHFLAFVALRLRAARHRREMADLLQRFTDGLPGRSRLSPLAHLSNQIDAFVADVEDVLHDRSASPSRQVLRDRLKILDESRTYLDSLRFETAWSVARNMIEAYPSAGILGTILAIGAALSAGGEAGVSVIVSRFGEAIWSTFAGLLAAIVLSLVSSFLEPTISALEENRRAVRQVIGMAKRELAIAGDPAP